MPPTECAFDPEAIAVLSSAYAQAIQGQSASAREDIAKCIIALASEGECDPDMLCQGALAICMTRAPLCRDQASS